ncbi:MAG: sialate O-acetylesterase, partial [Eubacteriales bacterium]
MITNVKSILMMGQSNMAGRGEFDDVPEIINPDCFMMRNGYWQPMREPINPDRSIWGYYHSGRGLAASFADECAKHFNEKIGLIPCAEGNTRISQWMPGEILFENAVNNAKLAQRSSEIIGIIWHQGENDSVDEKDANAYGQRFITMISALRAELGNDKIPVIVGEPGRFIKHHVSGKFQYIDTVIRTLKDMPNQLPYCGFANSEGLTDRGDGL